VDIDSSTPSSENSRANGSDSDHAEDEQNVILPAPGDMTDAQKEKYLLDNLKEWGCSGVTKSKVDDLLKRLNPVFRSVLRSYKTLLSTPRTVAITSSANCGEMWCRCIVVNLKSLVTEEYLEMNNNARTLDINTDGLPLFKNSSVGAGKGFWPILGRLVPSYGSVFLIGAYCGLGDPKDLWFYLGDFVEEVADLRQNGVDIIERTFFFSIDKYIPDAKARAFPKCSKCQRGYDCCERCVGRGVDYLNRTVLLETDESLRTDEDFIEKAADLMTPKHTAESDNEQVDTHVVGVSPLLHCEQEMVTKFKLHGMHLIDKGVTRRIFQFWKQEPGPFKLSQNQIKQISARLLGLKGWFSNDFNRPQNDFEYVLKYKATELRRIALYDGMLVFKDIVNVNVYQNFSLYHCGIFILGSPKLFRTFNSEAESFLKMFVEHSTQLYGIKLCVHNVHSLIHFASECLAVDGPVDAFSAYPFKNKLKGVKAAIKSGNRPLQQLIKRDAEVGNAPKPIMKTVKDGSVSIPHLNNPDEQMEGRQFKNFM